MYKINSPLVPKCPRQHVQPWSLVNYDVTERDASLVCFGHKTLHGKQIRKRLGTRPNS